MLAAAQGEDHNRGGKRMNDITMSFTKKELQERAKKYMTSVYGEIGEDMSEDIWLARFGLLCAFIDEQFSEK